MAILNGVIETSTGDLLRAGFSDFENDGSFDGGTETFRTDVPFPAKIRGDQDNSVMQRWTGSEWIEVAQIVPTIIGDLDSGGFNANNAIYPSTDPATANSRNGHPIIVFDDTVAENVLFSGVRSTKYTGGDIAVHIDWVAETAITGGVTWGVKFECITPSGVGTCQAQCTIRLCR